MKRPERATLECRYHRDSMRIACAPCFEEGIKCSTPRGAAIVAHARALVGHRYTFLGRLPKALDCLGLALVARRAAGIVERVNVRYPHDMSSVDLAAEVRRFADVCEFPQEEVENGSTVIFDFGRAKHVGIATRDGTLIHASKRVGRVVEVSFDERWAARAALCVGA